MEKYVFRPQKPAASDRLSERVIISLERPVRWNRAKLAREPDSFDLFQREPCIKPAKRPFLVPSLSPLVAGNRFDLLQQSGFRVNVKCAAAEPFRSHGPDAATTPRIEDTYRPFVHEGVSLDEFEQVRLDVRADDAVGFDHRTSLGIDIVPRPAYLRTQPAFQRAEKVGEGFALCMWTPDAFELRQ